MSAEGSGATIRPADRDDLDSVVRVERSVFAEPWSAAAFERYLGAPGFLVADDDGVVGHVVGTVTPNHGHDIAHVRDLAVTPDRRRAGLGRRLLDRSLVRLGEVGGAVARLEVRASNEPAIGLYRDFGFETVRRHPRYYDDGEDALVMTLDLEWWLDRRE